MIEFYSFVTVSAMAQGMDDDALDSFIDRLGEISDKEADDKVADRYSAMYHAFRAEALRRMGVKYNSPDFFREAKKSLRIANILSSRG